MGRVNYEKTSRMYFSNPDGWNIVKTDKLKNAASLLKNTKVTSGSYKDLLTTDGEKVFIYCDPPYWRDTELSPNSKLYKYGFTEEDHKILANNIKECKHNVLISYDSHPKIKELYTDDTFRINELSWKYCGSSKKQKTLGTELVITNY